MHWLLLSCLAASAGASSISAAAADNSAGWARSSEAASPDVAAMTLDDDTAAIASNLRPPPSQQKRRNVVMIAVDDLRTELSIYPEGAHMKTPNFERLAKRSVTFERTYVQVAVCAASRTALLTSRWPDTSKTWTIQDDQYWRFTGGNFTTLPQTFKDAGYLTIGMGTNFCKTIPLT